MTTRHERIRKELERHGYSQFTSEFSSVENFVHLGGSCPAESEWRCQGQLRGSRRSWNQALSHFLADKSMTGARIKDLHRAFDWSELVETTGDIRAVSKDPDQYFAELWREVHIDEVPE